MKRDPFRGLGVAARAFVIGVAVALAVVFGLAVYAAYFADFGPLSWMLRAVLFLAFGGAVFALQLKLSARLRGIVDGHKDGPLMRTLTSTQETLRRQARRAKRRASDHPPDEDR